MKHRNDLTKTESRRICLFLLNLAVIAGVVIGAIIASGGKGTSIAERSWLHQYFAPVYSGNTVLAVFRNTFFSSAIFLVSVFILGFFSIGQPLGIILLIYRGIGIGASVAQMYILNGTASLPSVLLLIIPKAIVLSFTAALGVREMLRLSSAQFRFLFTDDLPEEKMKREIKLYFIKFLVLILITVLTAMMDSAVNYIFMDLY